MSPQAGSQNEIPDRSYCNVDRRAFQLRLYGTTAPQNVPNANGWQSVYLDGPYHIRSNVIGTADFASQSNLPFQVNTFFMYRGDAAPPTNDWAVQSRGVGSGFAECPGTYWFRPIRLDVQMDLIFTPAASPDVSQDTVDSFGLGNLHLHSGYKLNTMANSGGDPTIPDPLTYLYYPSNRCAKAVVIYIPRVIYLGTYDGGANPNWVNAGDSLVDQSTTGALLGVSTFIQASNLGQYNTWNLTSNPGGALGNGLDTIQAGDRVAFVGDTRFVGPMFIFNLNTTGPTYFTIEVYT